MLRHTGGASLVEYALILALVAIAATAALHVLGHHVSDAFGCALQFNVASCR